ncbi:MAG: segregation/condensation protein A [Oscillospiraceae bacterium]
MENPMFFLEGIVKNRNEMQDFNGPLNLILMLLSKNKIEIRDLQISSILEQYLEYITKMKEMDLYIASEFVQMASLLFYIKTRTLLAGDEEVSELEELISSLEQLKCKDAYMSVKAITPELLSAAEQGLLMFSKSPEPLKPLGNQSIYSHEPFELLAALASIFSRGGKSQPLENTGILVPKRIIYNVREKSVQLLELLRVCRSKKLHELFGMSHSRSELIATFISVLELCSVGSLEISSIDGEPTISFCGEAPSELLDSIAD